MSDRDHALQAIESMNVSRETIARLEVYADEIKKWNPKINLVAPSTMDELWHRHFLDSLQIVQYFEKEPKNWLDIGSGGGFPALVLAAHFVKTNFKLIESDQRKSAFLRKTAREMRLTNVEVISERIEALDAHISDVISARACASLAQLLEWSLLHSNSSTVFIFPKGKNWQSELTLAREYWQIAYEAHQSVTDDEARILYLTKVMRNG